jgi:hypothetical protein
MRPACVALTMQEGGGGGLRAALVDVQSTSDTSHGESD